MTRPIPWINRVRIRNYKSIAACDVSLGPLTVLVGPNGAGKSNFLDALAFVGEAVASTPHQAIEARGGLGEILRRVPEPTDSFGVSLDLTVPWGPAPEQWARGSYGFEIGRGDRRGRRPIEVIHEECLLTWQDVVIRFELARGSVDDTEMSPRFELEQDRLYLPLASGRRNYAPLFGHLRGMRFYNLDPHTLRRPEPKQEGAVLGQHGEHLGDVIGQLAEDHPPIKQRYDDYLSAIVPGFVGLDRTYPGTYVTVQMRQDGGGEAVFGPDAMSDGTIRAAGILAALFQPWVLSGLVSLVGVEEPEAALHPAAAGALFDALTEASERVQVIATSQSADLLDRDEADPGMVRVVTSEAGLTVIGELDDASRAIVGERRFTLGELMRANQLQPARPAGPGEGPTGTAGIWAA